ncbi:hypothetical protein Pmar_PMAR022305 [Perkinsus marinus ATCC 50983]|uniref:Integrase catalytic domain-containing protein n=1 Tax=Perkinsus marinus (strain ATCC 50983 / TXsc) TaxID=423536 RepID=C5KDQ7_PERM5|nr:hypothetical protein Pmar_PMAR022305 [Perkinsus marinus ATCC 50983]EER17360.1 hypothetical protein Pmar_PMAR022305 [Perkinsus marinus ATCC 50983]|eukprot:XP_002785564.1 hypothetical protein Pmar_PMAR022305 [Perkinsus marinus ATCC 50983]
MHDNDKAFQLQFTSWCMQRNIVQAAVPLYAPESNSAIERHNRTFHDGLRACIASTGVLDWTAHYDQVVNRINHVPNSTTKTAPYDVLFKVQHHCPLRNDYKSLDSFVYPFPPDHSPRFQQGSVVARRSERAGKLDPAYEGHYEVLEEVRPDVFSIRRIGATNLVVLVSTLSLYNSKQIALNYYQGCLEYRNSSMCITYHILLSEHYSLL